MTAYITKKDLEDRISTVELQRIYDDNNDGQTDTTPVTRLIKDACSKVDSYLRGMYPLPWQGSVPNEIVRLTLDVAEAFAAKRHPAVVKRDWKVLLEQAEKELGNLRSGKTRLDIPNYQAPDPPTNTGARTGFSGASVIDPEKPQGFWSDMGDFSR